MLDGEKKWIGNASFADLVVIWARDVEDEQVKGFVVEKDTEGMTFDKQEDKIALRVVQNAEIHLHGVRVPEANRLQKAEQLPRHRQRAAGDPDGRRLAGRRLRPRRLRARAALHQGARAVRPADRRLPARAGPAGEDARQRHRLHRDVRPRLAAAGRRAAQDEHASLAKAYATVRMRETVGWAREVLGGNGILLEHHVGRFVADAEAIYSYEGTREINTLIVGRAITGESAFV